MIFYLFKMIHLLFYYLIKLYQFLSGCEPTNLAGIENREN
jgi:hypothetical protein